VSGCKGANGCKHWFRQRSPVPGQRIPSCGERTKPIEDAIHRNKLKIFGQPASKPQAKGKQQIKSLKNDMGLFSRLYIGCQNRDGNLDEFFQHENQDCPPALSDCGGILLGAPRMGVLRHGEDFPLLGSP